MKVIEAMKKVKYNDVKLLDLRTKIGSHCANLSVESPVYGDETDHKVKEWIQSCTDITQECVRLLCAIQKTNLQTQVTIELGGKSVTKSVAEWVWRRRKFVQHDLATWKSLTDRGLQSGAAKSSTGIDLKIELKRWYDPVKRDEMVNIYSAEPGLIDAALEISNAVTDLIE